MWSNEKENEHGIKLLRNGTGKKRQRRGIKREDQKRIVEEKKGQEEERQGEREKRDERIGRDWIQREDKGRKGWRGKNPT